MKTRRILSLILGLYCMWEDILTDWETGIPMRYPPHLGRFEWNTSVLKKGARFFQKFKVNPNLPAIQNYTEFQDYILNSKNKYVTSFPSLSRDTILVIPMPVDGKNYVTLKDFIDNAPEIQQKKFWKKVAQVARKCMKNGDVWISVHGMGVPYTHVRISYRPKYYFVNF